MHVQSCCFFTHKTISFLTFWLPFRLRCSCLSSRYWLESEYEPALNLSPQRSPWKDSAKGTSKREKGEEKSLLCTHYWCNRRYFISCHMTEYLPLRISLQRGDRPGRWFAETHYTYLLASFSYTLQHTTRKGNPLLTTWQRLSTLREIQSKIQASFHPVKSRHCLRLHLIFDGSWFRSKGRLRWKQRQCLISFS